MTPAWACPAGCRAARDASAGSGHTENAALLVVGEPESLEASVRSMVATVTRSRRAPTKDAPADFVQTILP